MAYLNEKERDDLLNKLKDMNFKKAKGKLERMDPEGRLAFYRNVQTVGKWMTRFDLTGLGTRVTLIEENHNPNQAGRNDNDFELVEIIVEPLPGNRT